MRKIKDPLSVYNLLRQYHSKHYWKFLVPGLVIVVIRTVSTIFSVYRNSMEFIWFEYLKDFSIIFGVVYLLFLIVFIPYYWINTHPYKIYLMMASPKLLKIIFVSLFVASGLPIIIKDYSLNLEELREIIKLSWGIFTVSVTLTLVTFFFISNNLKNSKDKITIFDKPYHNSIVFLSLTTFFLLSFNIFFLSLSTLSVFITSRESGIVEQILVKTSIWLSLNVVVSATYDFIKLIKDKQKELTFQKAELIIEVNELKSQSEKFLELRKIMKTVSSSSKVIDNNKKKLELVFSKFNSITTELLNLDKNNIEKKMNYFEKRKLLKKIKNYEKLIKKMDILVKDIKNYEDTFKEIKSKIEQISEDSGSDENDNDFN